MTKRWSWHCLAAAACSLGLGVVALTASAGAQGTDPGWTTVEERFATRVEIPRGVFTMAAENDPTTGHVFTTADGRARLHVFALRNEQNESPARFLRRNFTKDRRVLTYDRVASNFFVVSRPKDDRILYRRCNFARDGVIRCVEFEYPRAEKRAWDATVTRVSLSLRPR